MSIPSYNPGDWYWFVNGDESRVFASKAGDYVPVANEAYQAWLAAGGVTTRIGSEAELGEVLDPHSLRPNNAGVLDGYKESQARRLTIEIVSKVLFNHENRLRALEGKQAVTPAQMRNFIKGLM